MGKLNASGMAMVEIHKEERKAALHKLTATPFDLNNIEHVQAIKKYTDEFELNTNLMYLFQAMNTGLTAWGSLWVIGLVLPTPEFISYFASTAFYFGVTGFILQRFNMTDFAEQLSEMKCLYNWSFKKGSEHYNAKINNDELLAHPEAQRMIKLIAPLCTTDFIIAWDRTTKNEEKNDVVGNLMSAAYVAVKSTFSFFYPATLNVDLNKINALKADIETRKLDLGTFNGAEQALRYFVSSTEFRALMSSKVQDPLGLIKEQIPDVIQDIAFTKAK